MQSVRIQPTKEQAFVVMRRHVLYVPAQVVFKPDVKVLLVDGKPMAEVVDDEVCSAMHGMHVLIDADEAVRRGYATAVSINLTLREG